MGGSRQGGLKAARQNKHNYGDNFYQRIGRLGGKAGDPKKKGFAANRELARTAGIKGGKRSRQGWTAASYAKYRQTWARKRTAGTPDGSGAGKRSNY